MRHSLRLLAAVVAVALALAVAPARGDEVEALNREARGHFLAGQSAYRAGAWQVALDEFTAGYALSPRPEFLYNIALAHWRLGHADEAIAFCQRFLASAPSSEYAPQARALLADLEKQRKPPPPAPKPSAIVAPAPPTTTPPPPAPSRHRVSKAAWIAIGVGTAVVVGGAIALGVVLGTHEAYPSSDFGPVRVGF